MISEEKQSLRNEMRVALAGMSPAMKAEASGKIRACLESLAVWKAAERVLGFLPAGSEPMWLMESFAGKTFAFPRIREHEIEAVIALDGEDFAPGRLGIREPRGTRLMEHPDLILVPGVAFDRHGGRMGRGRGHYDRFLAGNTVKKLGICFACQIVGSVPMEAHDQTLDGVITENGLVAVPGAGIS